MRWALVAGALALAAGCRAAHEAVVKQRLAQERLFQADLPLSLAEVDALLQTRRSGPLAQRCTLCLVSSYASQGGVVYCVEADGQVGCVRARELALGHTRLEPVPEEAPLSAAAAREVWRLLDPAAAAEASRALEFSVAALAAEAEARFQPRWTFFGGGRLAAVVAGPDLAFGFGGHAGARRWMDAFLLVGAGLDYEALSPTLGRATVHTLGAELRVDLSLWREENARAWNLPEYSLGLSVTPVLALGGRPAGGVRGVVAIHMVHLRGFWSPVDLEVGYQALTVAGASFSGPRVGLGVGF